MKSSWLTHLILIIFCLFILILGLRGLPGNPNSTEFSKLSWRDRGPFELSPERGRFALTYSLVENKSFQFSDQIGKFADPDVGYSNGRYVSLFAPFVSFIVIPGYIIGHAFGISQVGTFAVISLFALFNFILIRLIALKLNANEFAATLGGVVFLFATPAFTYGVNLYQHHISTFLILLSIYSLLKFDNLKGLIIIFFLLGMAIPIDNPNLILMAPIGFYALSKIFQIKKFRETLSVVINYWRMLAILVVLLPMLLFFWSNKMSYGNPFQLAGTVSNAKIDIAHQVAGNSTLQALSSAKNNKDEHKSAIGFFKTRNMLNGFYIHLISPDRGILVFTPVILLGFLGAILAYKRQVKMISLLFGIVGMNFLIYSMWGDPWGGWAFGSRYLIPSYAILAIFLALGLSYFKKNWIFLSSFFVLLCYSVFVNSLGAVTSNANPPKIEAVELEQSSGVVQKYSFDRNLEYIKADNSKSFVYQSLLSGTISVANYLTLIVTLIVIFSGVNLWLLVYKKENF